MKNKMAEMAMFSLIIIVLFLVFHIIASSYDDCYGACSVEAQ